MQSESKVKEWMLQRSVHMHLAVICLACSGNNIGLIFKGTASLCQKERFLLWELCNDTGLMITNTLNDCADPGWTWNRRDGAYRTRVDYMLVSKELIRDTIRNQGAMNWEGIQKKGVPIDHRPVSFTCRIRLLHQRGHNGASGDEAGQSMVMSSRNPQISSPS